MIGLLVAGGRDADVYAYGAGRVLRRYRGHGGVPREVELMRLARAHGYPVLEADALSDTDMLVKFMRFAHRGALYWVILGRATAAQRR